MKDKEQERIRQDKKSSKPKDSRHVDGWEQYSPAGKGMRNRFPDWYTQDITEKLKEIFDEKKEDSK